MDPKLKSARITGLTVLGALLVGAVISHFLFGDYRAEQSVKKFAAEVVASYVSAKVPE